MENKAEKFFLAANCAGGFVSHFEDCYNPRDNWRVYIIKGGPGTGKSSFMRYMAHRAYEKGKKVTLCPCTSDPDSLDGVIIEEDKTVFLDGTAPHTVEPKLAGVCEEIINLGEFWNGAKLRAYSSEIIALTSENKLHHKTASRYITAAGQLYLDNLKIAAGCTDFKKVERFSKRLCAEYIKPKSGLKNPEARFLSAVTPKGVVSFPETVTENYKTVIVIEDRFGAASNAIMNKLCAYATANGYKTFALKNPILPDKITDHLLIPELSLAFLREYEFVSFDTISRKIHARRFTDAAAMRSMRSRTFFNRRIAKSLLLSAKERLLKAKQTHDSIEKYYVDAMDFSSARLYAEKLADKIFN